MLPNISCPPVLLLLFNRPTLTLDLIDLLREVAPQKLYVSIDGARANNPDDLVKIREIREILTQVDWPCDLRIRASEVNQGCKYGPYNGINWLFDNEEIGIILEDDCLPELSFFRYCAELLELYRSDVRVMMISGDDFSFGSELERDVSFYFHKYQLIWGWATWRRAWRYMDLEMESWNGLNKWAFLSKHCNNIDERLYWLENFDLVSASSDQSIWDYQWLYSMWAQNGLCISPSGNLIRNVGFGTDATHTIDKSPVHDVTTVPMKFPLDVCNVVPNSRLEELIRIRFYMPRRRNVVFIISWVKRQLFRCLKRALCGG